MSLEGLQNKQRIAERHREAVGSDEAGLGRAGAEGGGARSLQSGCTKGPEEDPEASRYISRSDGLI